MKKIFILTGEPSGDKLAAEVIKQINLKEKNIQYLSVGGENLKQLNIKSIFELKDITYIGITSVILNLFRIRKIINQTVEKVIEFNPDILFSVDSQLSLRVAEKINTLTQILKRYIMFHLKFGFGEKEELKNLRITSIICFYYLILRKNIMMLKTCLALLLVTRYWK